MTTDQIIALIVGTGLTVLLGIIGYLVIRTLTLLDQNQTKLSERLDEGLGEAFTRIRSVELGLTGLKAEHKINHGRL